MNSGISTTSVHFLIALTLSSLAIAQAGPPQTKCPMIYMIMISSRAEESKASLLVKSIRAFGGVYNAASIVIVNANPAVTRGESLAGDALEIVDLQMDARLRSFPFSSKVYACAQVEEMVAHKTRWLVWLNPDALVVAPPAAIVAHDDAWACLRPVHLKNIGDLADAPISDYWQRIYGVAGLDPAKAWSVESYVDKKRIRGYFNSGCMAFDPARGILRAWKAAYERLLFDPVNFTFYTSDSAYAIFCHQAVLSAVVMAKAGPDKVNLLPPSFGYPLHLQGEEGFDRKADSLRQTVILLYQDRRDFDRIGTPEPYKSWLAANLR